MTVEPTHDDLTIQDAADLLRLSRLQLNKLIETGALPVHRTGEHKRVRFADVMRTKGVQDRASSEAMSELAALQVEEFGPFLAPSPVNFPSKMAGFRGLP